MKELDFLPDWYKDRKRRHSLVRKQYIALVIIFLMMVTFNFTATHRAGKVAAEVAHHEDQRMHAETVVHEFNLITKELNQMRTRANQVRRIDPRIDIAAILAEISHVVDESIVLSRLELVAEPFSSSLDREQAKIAQVRPADNAANAKREISLGNVKLRIDLAGVAIHPARVADLVCRLDESPYFQKVLPSYYGKAKVDVGSGKTAQTRAAGTGANVLDSLDVTTFEITCYLANYEEVEAR